jgi:hypothetical protein
MYVRTKIAKGHTYYQIVEGRREEGRVRQHVLCSLGTDSDPRAVLQSKKRAVRTSVQSLEFPQMVRLIAPAENRCLPSRPDLASESFLFFEGRDEMSCQPGKLVYLM